MKAIIAFVVLLFVIAGAGVGVVAWGKLSRMEPRGVGLEVDTKIPESEKEAIAARYNEILDRTEILMPTVQKHDLKGYYKVDSDEEALELFREDSYITLPDENSLHVLFRGKRMTRKLRDSAAETLAEDFVKAARVMGAK